ncbi:CidA/LrgA family protein [Clostridium transplantifaecale]|uniref:CidA/LrgA family protein n=1 Tax=Clostridium transplantifaecale TaxID=2479838 RepID=UPI000F632C4E|nr:CidA/LrgA family protein [Clostridium transplantifaecale]
MKYLKEATIIFGITMVGEILNHLLPLPVPAGVYGLFILLVLLCAGTLKVEDVSGVGDFFLDTMPLMFIPAGAGLLNSVQEVKDILIPLTVISVVSTIFVMAVTGRMAQRIIRGTGKRKEKGYRL